jgi:hypothetical protein
MSNTTSSKSPSFKLAKIARSVVFYLHHTSSTTLTARQQFSESSMGHLMLSDTFVTCEVATSMNCQRALDDFSRENVANCLRTSKAVTSLFLQTSNQFPKLFIPCLQQSLAVFKVNISGFCYSQRMSCCCHGQTWLFGKWTFDADQQWAPPGTNFHQFVVPSVREIRKDCTYAPVAGMFLPKQVIGIHACEVQTCLLPCFSTVLLLY